MGGAQSATDRVNYLALICAVAIVAVPAVIVASFLLAQLGAFPRAANVFDPSIPRPVALVAFIANILAAVGAGVLIYGIAFRCAAGRGDTAFGPYFRASMWALIGVYFSIHVATAVYVLQLGGVSPWLALVGPVGYIGFALIYSSMTSLAVTAVAGGVVACLIGTTLIAFVYWRFSRSPSFALGVEPLHFKATLFAALVATLLGLVFLLLSFARFASISAFAASISTLPLSAAASVAHITMIVLVAEAVFAQRRVRPELFGWVAAFAIGMVLITLAEAALIAAVSVIDTQTPASIGAYALHKFITLPQVALASGVVGLVYGYVVGARELSWTTND